MGREFAEGKGLEGARNIRSWAREVNAIKLHYPSIKWSSNKQKGN